MGPRPHSRTYGWVLLSEDHAHLSLTGAARGPQIRIGVFLFDDYRSPYKVPDGLDAGNNIDATLRQDGDCG